MTPALNVLGVMAGGALGALARLPRGGGGAAEVAANALCRTSRCHPSRHVSGSFLLALVATIALQGRLGGVWLLTLGTGFCGAFTTFSTFELDANGLLKSGQLGVALLYVGGNLFLGYGALLLGQMAGNRASGLF